MVLTLCNKKLLIHEGFEITRTKFYNICLTLRPKREKLNETGHHASTKKNLMSPLGNQATTGRRPAATIYMHWSWIEDSSEDVSFMYINQSSSSTSANVIEGTEILFFIRPYFGQLLKAFSLSFSRRAEVEKTDILLWVREIRRKLIITRKPSQMGVGFESLWSVASGKKRGSTKREL